MATKTDYGQRAQERGRRMTQQQAKQILTSDEMREADGTYKKQWVTFDAWKPFYTIKEVIAWMPFPELYKEVNV